MPSGTGENALTTVEAVVGEQLLRVVTVAADHAVADLVVSPSLHQPYGIVHGGVYAAAAEFTAALGAQAFLDGRDPSSDDDRRVRAVPTAVGTQFLRSVRDGVVRVEATPVHQGRSQQLWQVRMTRSSAMDPARSATPAAPATSAAAGSAAAAAAPTGEARLVATAEVRLRNRAAAALEPTTAS